MTKSYPLEESDIIFDNENQTFEDVGMSINSSLEGIVATEELLNETTDDGLKKLISLEFNWLPREVVEAYNSETDPEKKKELLVKLVYSNCKLNCKGCYVKNDGLFGEDDLLYPDQIMDLIEDAVKNLGTVTLKYLGPSEFFRDKDVFQYLDRFEKMGITLNIFAKDPMFGDDKEVEELFGEQGIHTSEELVKKLSEYKSLRILYNFRTFDDELTNDLVSGGYEGKEDYHRNYKNVQNKSIKLLHKYFVKPELEKGKESRLVILNTPIVQETIDESFEIFKYFTDRDIPVCSTTSMKSGCGGELYEGIDERFIDDFAYYYAQAIDYSIKRGIITEEDLEKTGPSPYAGMAHCMQLCNGVLIRSTGKLLRCPGADDEEWAEKITPEELLEEGLSGVWPKTKNYARKSKVGIRCHAKPGIFTEKFNEQVLEYYRAITQYGA
jgi:hypothetical protein